MIAALALAAAIRIGGVGAAPDDLKVATLESDATRPVAWRVRDAHGATVLRGASVPLGRDEDAGRAVHRIDVSAVRHIGRYRLEAGDAAASFTVAPRSHRTLARDALAYFRHHRAGADVPASLAGARWARPAGHVGERATCFAGVDGKGVRWPGCGYTLDVAGGWYDAGDHGKYVVNGGIALWTLLNMAERGQSSPGLLDEARWQLAFLLKMQVPAGTRYAFPGRGAADVSGMAHHKVADARWTALPMRPDRDAEVRLLYPPTTAATLNLAAGAAQGARVWRTIDPAFARRCAEASARAWAAAERNPAIFAPDGFTGSGAYGDRDVTDERFWAAAERWALTRDPALRARIDRDPHRRAVPAEPGWPATSALGLTTLALHGDPAARARLIAAADGFRAAAMRSGYGIPSTRGTFVWGSNAVLLNRAMILALAADWTGDRRYRAPVVATLDYLTGRNPLGRSYVAGHGVDPMRHPHHRHWAQGIDPAFPPAPPGALSGGPNARPGAEAAAILGPCAPMTCWRDDARLFSLNEVAINWNAPLAWVATWRDATEQAR